MHRNTFSGTDDLFWFSDGFQTQGPIILCSLEFEQAPRVILDLERDVFSPVRAYRDLPDAHLVLVEGPDNHYHDRFDDDVQCWIADAKHRGSLRFARLNVPLGALRELMAQAMTHRITEHLERLPRSWVAAHDSHPLLEQLEAAQRSLGIAQPLRVSSDALKRG